jgi:outer membrane protein assembly factor BamB
MNMRTLPAFCCLLAATVTLAPAARADDWPQWRGPDRTEISREKGLLKSWPSGGPKLLWTYSEAGNGYSGPAVVGDRLYIMGTEGDSDVVLALDTKNGKKLWSTRFAPVYEHDRGNGSRGTPTVDGDVLYGLGGQGELVCLAVADGSKRWSVNLKKDLGGQMMSGWGYSESPLVDGDKLICTPGGRKGTLAALDKKNGKVIWRSADLTDAAGYASPIAVDFGGTRMIIQMTGKGVAGVDARDGKLLWRYTPQSTYRTAVVPTPIFHDGHVYVTSGYNAGCDLIKLSGDSASGFKAEKVYANKNMVNHHGGVVLFEGHVYGYSDSNGWICQDFKTGKIVWKAERSKLGKGSVTFADGKLYCYSERDGTAVLIDASPKGWQEHGRFKIPKESQMRARRGSVWTHPVVANGKLYLRDQELLYCFDVKEK